MSAPYTEPDDGEIDAIHENAHEAAAQAWGPGGVISQSNPYDEKDPRHDIWAYAFRNSYASSNGY